MLDKVSASSEEDAYFYSAYSKDFFNQKLVLIDLEAQTVTDIEDVPLSQKHYTSPLMIDEGFVYESVEAVDDAYVYRIDIETGEATRGGQILGKTIEGFYLLNPAAAEPAASAEQAG